MISEAITELQRLAFDIERRLGSMERKQSSWKQWQENWDEIQSKLFELRDKIQRTQIVIDKAEAPETLQQIISHYQTLQMNVRKLKLQSKRMMEDQEEQGARDDLLDGVNEQQAKKTSTQLSKSITEAMKRTNQMMNQQLERSIQSSRAMNESSRMLSKTKDIYSDELQSALHKAQQSVTTLSRREFTDRILLFLSVSVFFSVVLYILKERLFY